MPLPKKNNSVQGYSPLFGDPSDNPDRHDVIYPDGSKTTVNDLDPNDRYRDGDDPNLSEIYKKTYERYDDKKKKPAWYNKDGEPVEDQSNNGSEDTEKVESKAKKKRIGSRDEKTQEQLIREEQKLLKKEEKKKNKELRRKEKAEENEKLKSMSKEERKQYKEEKKKKIKEQREEEAKKKAEEKKKQQEETEKKIEENKDVKEPSAETKENLPASDKAEVIEQAKTRNKYSRKKFGRNRRTMNRNGMTRGMDNGQFTYDENIEPEPSYLDDRVTYGVPSLFNNYTVFTHCMCSKKEDFFDNVWGDGKSFADKTGYLNGDLNKYGDDFPTLSQLLEYFSPDKTMVSPYYANDFLYAKYYNKIPLNHLITLRRFPNPTYDSMDYAATNEYRPLAQAITYFGEPTKNKLSSIFKINGKINWKKVSAQIWDTESVGDRSLEDSRKLLDLPNIMSKNKAAGAVNAATGAINRNFTSVGTLVDLLNGKGDFAGRQASGVTAARAAYDFNYTHKVFGPVNVIKDTMTRDIGIGGDLSINLDFNYQLKSYNGINPKLAMLDLINNLLALTYYHAKWWGGANRFFPKAMSQFGFLGDQNAFYNGDYGKYFTSIKTMFERAGRSIINTGMKFLQNLLSGNWSAIAQMAFQGVGKILDIRSHQSRPNTIAVHSLVSGAPVGEYHLTIGNPFNPIACIGNLTMQSFTIGFSDDLGFMDFPEEITLSVELKRARPCDSADWQSILQFGQGRSYVPEKGMLDLINKVSNAAGTGKKTRIKSLKGISDSWGSVN